MHPQARLDDIEPVLGTAGTALTLRQRLAFMQIEERLQGRDGLSPVRGFSASALQSLALFNDEFVLRHCEFLAERVESMATTTESRVGLAFRLALLREPTADEAATFAALALEHGMPAACRVLFNTNEFLFVD